MKKFFRDYTFILSVYGSLALLATLLVLLYGKADIHLWVNRYNFPFTDFFFKYFTFLGDGIFAAIFVIVLLFVKFRLSLTVATAAILAGLVAQFLKRVIFPGIVRPAKFFENEYALYFVEGVSIHKSFSFPSGHTASAFAVFFCLIFTTRNRTLQLIYLVLALLVGYSRMYLSLHFLPDIIAGSLIGLGAALVAYGIFKLRVKNWMDSRIKLF